MGSRADTAVSERARALHQDSIVLDAHNDSVQRILIDGVDLGVRSDAGQADLPRFREGGLNVQVFAVWVDTVYLPYHAVRRTMQQLDALHDFLETYPDQVELARTASDARRIVANGKLAAFVAIEGGDAIQCDLGVLRMYHRMGASSMTLTHSRTTDWADSSTDEARWNGLNDLGREVIRELDRLHMVVDVSHVSDATVRDVLETTSSPIVASHSSCRALSDHPRNLSDEMLEAIADNGGVIGMNFYCEFTDQAYHDKMKARHVDLLGELNRPPEIPPEQLDDFAAERLRTFFKDRLPRPPFERILEHIDHAVEVAGIDHVGLGADMDATDIPMPEGMDDVTDYPKITEGLLERGYAEGDVSKILGGNFLRVYEQVIES